MKQGNVRPICGKFIAYTLDKTALAEQCLRDQGIDTDWKINLKRKAN
jgi:hypothetical protein